MSHLIGFLMFVAVARLFFKGGQLIRMIAWGVLWQVMIPLSEPWVWKDAVTVGLGYWVAERLYLYLEVKSD